MLLWLLGLILIFCFILFYVRLKKSYSYWKVRGIVYEKPTLIAGSLSFFTRKSVWQYFYDLKKKHPDDYVGVFLGIQPALVVQSPQLARKVLSDSDCFQDRFSYSGTDSDPVGSLNLFAVKGPLRKEMQQALSPIFTTLRLKKLTDLLNINSRELTEKIERDFVKKQEHVNLKELMAMYISDTLAFSVFGIKVGTLNDDQSPLWYITKHMAKCTFMRGLEILTVFFIPSLAEILRMKFFSAPATDFLKKMFRSVINEREERGEKNDTDLVGHFLKIKENFTSGADADRGENLMVAQAAAFIMASIETSTSTLTYCFSELAYHQEEQETLYKEIDNALRQTGKQVLDYNDLVEMKYLTAIINETLRKYVPLQHLDRVAVRDYKLTDNVTVEKGIPVYVNLVALQHDERFFPEPEKWRPERFLGTADFDTLNYTFLPFGEGHRSCIGKRYGMLQLRTAIAHVVHKFRIEPVMPYILESDPYSIVLSPSNGGSVKFVTR
ncbi:cytochrome P450 6j1-like isoform X1 [Colias croceus]|uniref:cytochrome P450 6j1-like isoform X1 n=1 Tax=Colias crocea TaxID=72248 RepID=UPI001E27A476|nr:cytochrome P450 6j1-like isoform X1 [Colias croceus]